LRNLLIFLILGLVIYSNTFQGEFLFDDTTKLEENLLIRHLSHPKAIWEQHSTRFLTYMTFALNYRLGRLDVFGYHLVNIMIHLTASLFVSLLVLTLFQTPALRTRAPSPQVTSHLALCAGLIFLTHPVQTQAVTYLVQRATSLATCLYLGAILLYVKARLRQSRLMVAMALLTTVASMMTKPIAITLPFAIVLVECFFFGIQRREVAKRAGTLAPFLMTLLIVPLMVVTYGTADFTGAGSVTRQTFEVSRGDYLLTQFNVIRTYVRLLFLPIRQNADYDYPISHSLLEPKTLLSCLLLIAILLSAVWLFKQQRLISFGIFFFFLGLLPESSLYPLQDVIFEHRLYLPMVGVSVSLASALLLLSGRDLRRFTALFLSIALVFSIATYRRNRVWRDGIRLWGDTVQKSPGKARPYHNLGFAYGKREDYDKAIAHYERSIEIRPNYPKALDNLGALYSKKGDQQKAAGYFRRAIKLDPDYAKAYNNLGIAYGKEAHYDRAIAYFEKAIELDPDFAKAYDNLGVVFGKRGDHQKARGHFEKSLALDPDYAPAHLNLGIAYRAEKNTTGTHQQIDSLRELNRNDLADRLESLGR